ncbi:MAG: hypothetical protein KDD69_19735 [Bdellovibrionales bacterium]|nr:hypothetical protein [Bdellovibrionales bacterium]
MQTSLVRGSTEISQLWARRKSLELLARLFNYDVDINDQRALAAMAGEVLGMESEVVDGLLSLGAPLEDVELERIDELVRRRLNTEQGMHLFLQPPLRGRHALLDLSVLGPAETWSESSRKALGELLPGRKTPAPAQRLDVLANQEGRKRKRKKTVAGKAAPDLLEARPNVAQQLSTAGPVPRKTARTERPNPKEGSTQQRETAGAARVAPAPLAARPRVAQQTPTPIPMPVRTAQTERPNRNAVREARHKFLERVWEQDGRRLLSSFHAPSVAVALGHRIGVDYESTLIPALEGMADLTPAQLERLAAHYPGWSGLPASIWSASDRQ